MLICPKCKLLYEKSTHCIRCGAPLVEMTSSEKKDFNVPPQPEIGKETPPVQKPKDKKEELESSLLFDFEEKFPPKPPPRIKREEPEEKPPSDMEKTSRGIQTHEQTSSKIPLKKPKRETSHIEKIHNRVPSPTYRNVSIVVLILIGGYLLWSIYSQLAPKKSNKIVPPSKESTKVFSPRPVSSAKPLTSQEPKVADDKKLDKKPPIPESETSVSVSTQSPPFASKTGLSDEKEVDHIRELFENIREANLKKNINLFISCYSAAFQDRDGKKRETLKNWENFTYNNLSYTLRKHSISGDTAGVIVEWVIRFSSKAGGKPQESKIVLDVTLERESGGWKIKNIKPIG